MSDAPATESVAAEPTAASIRLRLAAMMFVQYFIQGSYNPIVSVYVQDHLHFTPQQIGLFGSALAVGPLFAPALLGQLVDRLFATQRVLAVCHFAAGAVMFALYASHDVRVVMLLGALYSVLYVPTMMLTNALALAHLRSRDREFPRIRLWGTIGYVVPAWLIEYWWLSGLSGTELDRARGLAFALAGVAGIVMGCYSLTLPDTPPATHARKRFAPAVAAGLMRYRNLAVLVGVSFFVAMVHNFFFVWNAPFLSYLLRTGGVEGAWEQRIASLGQVSEVVVMACLGAALVRFGFKRVMLVGLAAYTLRCVVLALAYAIDADFVTRMTLAAGGQILHGFCFGCFLAVAYMYLDRVAPHDVRGSMQTLYGTTVVGFGALVGSAAAGRLGELCALSVGTAPSYDWARLWLSCAALAAACCVAFALLFPAAEPEPLEPRSDLEGDTHG